VSDNGCGIEPEHASRVFEPFFTTKPVGQGTGLGLSISYGLVERHKGRFELHSEPGHGATFSIRLPASCGRESGDGAHS
jgi:signal transduction histidine kinase